MTPIEFQLSAEELAELDYDAETQTTLTIPATYLSEFFSTLSTFPGGSYAALVIEGVLNRFATSFPIPDPLNFSAPLHGTIAPEDYAINSQRLLGDSYGGTTGISQNEGLTSKAYLETGGTEWGDLKVYLEQGTLFSYGAPEHPVTAFRISGVVFHN